MVAAMAADRALGRAHGLDVTEGGNRAFIEPEVQGGSDDLSILKMRSNLRTELNHAAEFDPAYWAEPKLQLGSN